MTSSLGDDSKTYINNRCIAKTFPVNHFQDQLGPDSRVLPDRLHCFSKPLGAVSLRLPGLLIILQESPEIRLDLFPVMGRKQRCAVIPVLGELRSVKEPLLQRINTSDGGGAIVLHGMSD